MDRIRRFNDLIVWQRAMELAKTVYKVAKKLPQEELYVLSVQMRKAAISIPSNIAEGQAKSNKDFLRFLSIALGSCAELETQLLLAVELDLLTNEDIKSALELLSEVGKMLNGLMAKLAANR